MSGYTVELTTTALAAIEAQARWRKVWIVALRHGHRLPRPKDLPDPPTS